MDTSNVFNTNTEYAKKYSDYYNRCINCCGQKYSNADAYSTYIRNYINGCLSKYRDFNDACLRKHDYWKDIFDQAHKSYTGLLSPVLSDVQSASNAASQTEQQRISDATQAANIGRNAGLGNSRAGLLGESCSGTNTSNVYSNAYTASAQNQGSTQADYLEKMGQACALCNCAQNMNNGAIMNAIDAAAQGAGSGAKLGASMAS